MYQALFLLSTDAPFSKSGQQSKINYESRFNAYKGILLQGAADPAIKATFAHLNSHVLSTTAELNRTSAGPTDRGEGVASGISALLRKMQLSDGSREVMGSGTGAGGAGSYEYDHYVDDEGQDGEESGEGYGNEHEEEDRGDGDGESQEDEVDNNDLVLHALQTSARPAVVHPAAPHSAAVFDLLAPAAAHRRPVPRRVARSAAPPSTSGPLPAAVTPPATIAPPATVTPPATSHRRIRTYTPPLPLATSQPADAHLPAASQDPEIRGSKKPTTKGKARAVPSAGGVRSTRSQAASGK